MRLIQSRWFPSHSRGRHSAADLSAPTIMQPRVWFPSLSFLFFNSSLNCDEDRTKIRQKEVGIWLIFKKMVSVLSLSASSKAAFVSTANGASESRSKFFDARKLNRSSDEATEASTVSFRVLTSPHPFRWDFLGIVFAVRLLVVIPQTV